MMRVFLLIATVALLSACSSSKTSVKAAPEDYRELEVKKPAVIHERFVEVILDEKFSKRCLEQDLSLAPIISESLKNGGTVAYVGDSPVELTLLINKIIPSGVKVFWNEGIVKNMRVEWDGRFSWIEHLDRLGKKQNIKLVFNQPQKHLTIEKSQKNKGGFFQLRQTPVEASCSPYYVIRQWTAHEEQSLRALFSSWSELSKWAIEWDLVNDVSMRNNLKINGDVIDAVEELVMKLAIDGQIKPNLTISVNKLTKVIKISTAKKGLNKND